jgi:heme exporter protein C
MERVESGLRWAASATMLAALFLIFCVVPTEAEMGIVQRIFYFHVPCAFTAYAGFFTVAVSSVVYLWKRSVAADRLAIAAAEVGVLFCTLVLVTGPIWARPIWGVWWTWDPQLTLTIILWSIYVAYVMLRAFGGDDDAIASYAAVLGIVGSLAIILNHYAVQLLEGIHPAVIRPSKGGGDAGLRGPWMGVTLATSSVAMLLLGGWLVTLRVRTERLAAEVAALRRVVDEGGGV